MIEEVTDTCEELHQLSIKSSLELRQVPVTVSNIRKVDLSTCLFSYAILQPYIKSLRSLYRKQRENEPFTTYTVSYTNTEAKLGCQNKNLRFSESSEQQYSSIQEKLVENNVKFFENMDKNSTHLLKTK